jgi:hypothetical protein
VKLRETPWNSVLSVVFFLLQHHPPSIYPGRRHRRFSPGLLVRKCVSRQSALDWV